MKIGFYSPYWRTMGGGEKYMLDIARVFPNDEVIFIGENEDLIKDAKDRFGFNHNNAKIITNYKTPDGKIKKKGLKDFDLFFYQCDGSVFIPCPKKNILLVQSPIHSPAGSLKDKIKLMFWQKIVCNSAFTAKFVKQKTGISPKILNPCIAKITLLPKENIILSVGRFFPHLHSKKQEVLIEVFKKLYACPSGAFRSEHSGSKTLAKEGHSRPVIPYGVNSSGNPDTYRLILAGSVANSDKEYLSELKKQASGYPIEFHENISYEEIKKLYGKAKIYWHAAGFGENLVKNPERAEHFGISTVEAISSNCYPLVFKAGGQTEIIGDNPEFYWETKEELLKKTTDLINNYELVIKNYEKIKEIPMKYSFENFKKHLDEILK